MSRILLVEDNKLSQKMMFYTLRHIGLDADMADDGVEAVDKASQEDYDLILMDIQMPGYDGYEATRLIRSGEERQGVRRAFIVGLTGNVYDGEREKCIKAGMDDFLPKPFDVEMFTELVRDRKVLDI